MQNLMYEMRGFNKSVKYHVGICKVRETFSNRNSMITLAMYIYIPIVHFVTIVVHLFKVFLILFF